MKLIYHVLLDSRNRHRFVFPGVAYLVLSYSRHFARRYFLLGSSMVALDTMALRKLSTNLAIAAPGTDT